MYYFCHPADEREGMVNNKGPTKNFHKSNQVTQQQAP